MITLQDVEKLAGLSRIALSEEEKASFVREIESILGYVSEIQNVSDAVPTVSTPALRNVLRPDGPAHESGLFTSDLLVEAPDREGEFFRVKRILP